MALLVVWSRKMVYFYFHSIMSHGIIFWGNSSQNNSIFKIQKRTIRIIVNSSSRTSCHELFKEVQTLTIYSQHIYSSLMFVIKIRYLLKSSVDVHNLSTRYNYDSHLPTANLTIFQKGAFYSELKCTIISHRLSESYHMVLDSWDWPWKEFSSKRLYSLEEYLSFKSYHWPRFLLKCM